MEEGYRAVGEVVMAEGQHLREKRVNWQNATLMQELYGKFMEPLLRGQMFHYSTAATGVAGGALGTSTAPMIWNPAGSGKLIIPVRMYIGLVSGAAALFHVVHGFKTGCYGPGTGNPVVSWTDVRPVNCKIGSGNASIANFAPATVSLTGAPTQLGNLGLAPSGAWAAAAANAVNWSVDFSDGHLAIPPGTAWFPWAANGAIAITAAIDVIGIEIPIPAGV
jgi:hypothetical protein